MPNPPNRSLGKIVVVALVLVVALILLVRFVGRRGGGPAPVSGPPVAGRVPVNANIGLGEPSAATSEARNRTDYLLVKPQYVLSYNDEQGGPNWVSWHLQSADIGAAERQNNFHPEPALPPSFQHVTPDDYTGSGYDRGHVCNSKDRTASAADNSETFSMANMLPQTPDLNRQVWESLESYCRTLAQQGQQLYIIAGGYGSAKVIGRRNKVNVPTNCWKIVVVVPGGPADLAQVGGAARVIAVDMPNVAGIGQNSWPQYLTTAHDIEQKTGLHFFTDLPQDVQETLKAKRDAGR